MYFLVDQHQLNLKNLKATTLRWLNAQMSPVYLAVPMILEKVVDDIRMWESPVGWIYEWASKYGPEKLDDAEKPYFDLSSTMVQLSRLSLNLWNGYEHFNFMNCLAVIDESKYEVVKTAISIRLEIRG